MSAGWRLTLAKLVATCCGIGYLKRMPGTVASLLTFFIVLGLRPWPQLIPVLFGVTFFLGLWAARQMLPSAISSDPTEIVIDEMCGMFLTCSFIPLSGSLAVMGLILFRVFDIWKPFPIRRIEHLPGGWGILMDDVVAALYANILLHLLGLVL